MICYPKNIVSIIKIINFYNRFLLIFYKYVDIFVHTKPKKNDPYLFISIDLGYNGVSRSLNV